MSADLEDLKNKAYKTAKARFNAAASLKSRQKSLVYFITLLTLAQISMSIALLKIEGNPYAALPACLSITFSVFIAIVSNSDSVSKDILNAHLLHKCGKDLMRLHDKMEADTSPSQTDIKSYAAEYSDIINDCPVNHATVDFHKVECQIAGKKIDTFCWVRSFVRTYSIVIVYLVFTAVIFYISYLLF